MDASKALQAIRTGNWEALVESLDTDHTLAFEAAPGHRITVAAIGKAHIKIFRDPSGTQINIDVHEEGALACQERCLASVQEQRMLESIQGRDPGQLWLNGELTAIVPDGAGAPIYEAALTALAHRLAGVIPDDPGGLTVI